MESDLERFLALVRRELGAEEARVLEPDHEPASDPCEILCPMTDGRALAARFASPPTDGEAKQRRLEMLAGTFDSVVEEGSPGRRLRPSVVRSLRDELAALCARAAASNAIVIDANSPIVWGAAKSDGVLAPGPMAFARPSMANRARPVGVPHAADGPGNDVGHPEPEEAPSRGVAWRKAISSVRNHSELNAVRKGRHVRYVERAGDAPLIAHSFAGIYLLLVVFDAPFDELRAERAIIDALPRIERLVMALPPLDPSPQAGVVSLRRSRRR